MAPEFSFQEEQVLIIPSQGQSQVTSNFHSSENGYLLVFVHFYKNLWLTFDSVFPGSTPFSCRSGFEPQRSRAGTADQSSKRLEIDELLILFVFNKAAIELLVADLQIQKLNKELGQRPCRINSEVPTVYLELIIVTLAQTYFYQKNGATKQGSE